jgi:Tfp pilus assembly protein PilN
MGPIQTSVGIHITDSALHLAVVQARLGRFHLLRSDELAGFPQLSDEDKRSALSALTRKHGLRRAHLFLTVPRKMGVCRNVELPVEVGDRVDSAVALQIESLSPWSSEEVYWGCAVERAGKTDKLLRVSVGIVPRAALDPIIEIFKSVSLPLAGAGLSALADAHAWVLCKKKSVEEARSQVFARPGDSLDTEALLRSSIDGAASAPPSGFGAIAASSLGLGKTPFGVNLIPAADRFRQNSLKWMPTYALAAGLAILAFVSFLRAPYQWRGYEVVLDSEIAALKPAVDEVAAQEEKLNQATSTYQTLKSKVETRDANLEALLELSRLLPPGSWIASYNSQGRSVMLSGFAESASAVQKVMEESALFEDVQFTSPVTRDGSGKDRFNIKAAVGVLP